MEYKISRLTIIKWYRINYKRLCIEVNKLNKQIEKLEEKIREFEIGRLGE